MEIAIVLGLFAVALFLFATEKLPVDIVSLILLVILVFTGVLTPQEAFAGFSNEIIIMLGSVFVISAGLQRTQVLEWLASAALRLGRTGERKLMAIVMATAGLVSAFMNNTTVTAVFLAPVIGLARRTGIAASRLLMPMAFASILGGTCTLIGTSTNLAVSGYISKSGLEPLGMFEIAPVGLLILVTGTLYMVVLGQRTLPHSQTDSVTSPEVMHGYLCKATVLPNSPLIGQRAFEWELMLMDCRILKVVRGESEFLADREMVIQPGDNILIEGDVETLLKTQKFEGILIETGREPADAELHGAGIVVAEVLVLPEASAIGQTLRETDFRQRYGLMVLAIDRHGRPLLGRLGDVELQIGDVLLVQGHQDRLRALRRDTGMYVLGEYEAPTLSGWRGWFCLGLFVAAIAVAALGWAPPAVTFLSAAIAAVLAGSLSIEKARESVDWRLLILIGAMTAFGTAMENSGAAELLSQAVVAVLAPCGTMAILAGFFILTIVLTQPMSNAAAALVVLPVALSAARELGADPRTFGIAVMLAASVSFITPFEPACVLVYGPGKYQFRDFLIIGGGLTLVLMVLTLLLIPIFWPLSRA